MSERKSSKMMVWRKDMKRYDRFVRPLRTMSSIPLPDPSSMAEARAKKFWESRVKDTR